MVCHVLGRCGFTTAFVVVVFLFSTFSMVSLYLRRQNLEQVSTLVNLHHYSNASIARAKANATANLETPLFEPPLRTKGRHIIDAQGKRLKLASVNWYGASDQDMVPGGLNVSHRDDIAITIRRMGFNSVRLPYADQMVRDNPFIAARLVSANPDLIGSRALIVFKAVVDSMTNAGLAVVINNHITTARWCCDGNLCDITWSNSLLGPLCPLSQTEDDWIENMETVMYPHVDNPLVIGIDLRNEPRGLFGSMGWNLWATAAERASARLHVLQPNWLMVVEGIASSNFLSLARTRPVKLTIPNRLVYSSHVYGWSGWGSLSPYWSRNWQSFCKDMHSNWGYLLEEDIAPVWLGEFGAPKNPNKGDAHYWTNLIRYMELLDVDFAYWALNPRKPKNNETESYGLVHDDWKTPQYDYRLYDMSRLMPQPGQ